MHLLTSTPADEIGTECFWKLELFETLLTSYSFSYLSFCNFNYARLSLIVPKTHKQIATLQVISSICNNSHQVDLRVSWWDHGIEIKCTRWNKAKLVDPIWAGESPPFFYFFFLLPFTSLLSFHFFFIFLKHYGSLYNHFLVFNRAS